MEAIRLNGSLLKTFFAPVASVGQKVDVTLSDVKLVTSYDWLDRGPSPKIAVPGHPPIWTYTKLPKKLSKDPAYGYLDRNGPCYPNDPLEALFHAVHLSQPEFEFRNVQVVSNRGCLRSLHRYISGTANRPFAFRVLKTRGTTFFLAWKKQPEEYEQPANFGHGFEELMTRSYPGLEATTGHHRVLQYSFGGLNMLVHSEVDACIAPHLPSDIHFTQKFSRNAATNPARDPQLNPLTVEALGQQVQQHSIVEISTKLRQRIDQLHYGELYSQMFWSQIPRLYVGLHHYGKFTTIKKLAMDEVLQEVGVELAKERMRDTKLLIEEVVALMDDQEEGSFALLYEGGVLQAFTGV